MKPDQLQKSFEYKGQWWLPEKPENRLFGTLSYDPIKGAKLAIFGSFAEESAWDF